MDRLSKIKQQVADPGRVLVIMASLVIVLAGVKLASGILIPFLMSFFVAIICSPAVKMLQKIKFPRAVAVFTVIAIIIVVCLLLASVVGSSVGEFKQNLPLYQEQINSQFAGVIDVLYKYGFNINKATVLEYFSPGKAMGMATNVLSSFSGMMANIFLILLTTIFMLFEADSLPKKVHMIYHDPSMRMRQIDKFLQAVHHYIAMKSLISLATAMLVGIVLSIVGVDFVVLWMLLAFLLNFVHNIGSLLAAVPPILLAVVQLGFSHAVAVAGGYFVINMLMGSILEPRVMGRGMGLSTLVVFSSLIFWGWLLGSVGMMLAVPLTMIVKIGLENSTSTSWVSALLEADQSSEPKTAES